jgi:hypothetical protein
VLRADRPKNLLGEGTQFRAGQERTTTRPLRANRHQFIANAVEMDEPADEVIFVVRLRGLRVA